MKLRMPMSLELLIVCFLCISKVMEEPGGIFKSHSTYTNPNHSNNSKHEGRDCLLRENSPTINHCKILQVLHSNTKLDHFPYKLITSKRKKGIPYKLAIILRIDVNTAQESPFYNYDHYNLRS